MPEISRFYGLSIRMYVERGERHHLPHLHVIYQGKAAAFRIDIGELVGGYLPLRQRRLVDRDRADAPSLLYCTLWLLAVASTQIGRGVDRASSRRVAGELAAFAE